MAFIRASDPGELENVTWTCPHCWADHQSSFYDGPSCECGTSWEWVDVLASDYYAELVALAAQQVRMEMTR